MAHIFELSVLLIPDIGIDIGMDTSIGMGLVLIISLVLVWYGGTLSELRIFSLS